MKVGPVHLIRDGTFRRLHALQNLWGEFSAKLAAAADRKNPLAESVLEHTHGLLHSPLAAKHALSWFAEPPTPNDPRGRAAAGRVIAAFHAAMRRQVAPPSRSMWDTIAAGKREFFRALQAGDAAAVQRDLDRMFRSNLTWGLGQVHESHVELLEGAVITHLHYHFIDNLVSLAEAVGGARVTSMAQDPPDHLRPLHKDPGTTYEAAAARLGFDPWFPAVGSSYGFAVAGRAATIDSLTHAYTAWRLRQLGAHTAYELGGGYGCLAMMARRAGIAHYTVFDLPWVNVLQGYFLIRALPEGSVRLFGESEGALQVQPYWTLYDAPANACDVLVNTDSLPEMGAATASAYLPHIHRVMRNVFLSINQEAKGGVPGVGHQNCVRELVEAHGGFRCELRQRHWMRQGYVEEVFAKTSPDSTRAAHEGRV